MCDFNNLDTTAKSAYHHQLLKCAEAFGGVNYFLLLLEAIRKTKPHPLTAKHCEFRFSRGLVKWEKVIFKDKLTLLTSIRVNENRDGNLLPPKDDHSYKKVLNLLRTVQPIEFTVMPKNNKDGEGFSFHAFDIVDKDTTVINPVFDAVFFCSVDSIKKVLTYTPKAL